jgi:hypothetical protein
MSTSKFQEEIIELLNNPNNPRIKLVHGINKDAETDIFERKDTAINVTEKCENLVISNCTFGLLVNVKNYSWYDLLNRLKKIVIHFCYKQMHYIATLPKYLSLKKSYEELKWEMSYASAKIKQLEGKLAEIEPKENV